jgi:hypothetical protein
MDDGTDRQTLMQEYPPVTAMVAPAAHDVLIRLVYAGMPEDVALATIVIGLDVASTDGASAGVVVATEAINEGGLDDKSD